MVALHNIDVSKCDVKTVIKGILKFKSIRLNSTFASYKQIILSLLFLATSLCFNETDVYTPEVLAVVINQLLEQTPLPTLLMRTVIQTLALHSKLTGFILNTLGRLVNKQVIATNCILKSAQVQIIYLMLSANLGMDATKSLGRLCKMLSANSTKEYSHSANPTGSTAAAGIRRSC